MSISVSDAQQIYNIFQEIYALLNDVELKTKELNNDLPKTQASLDTFKQLERVTLRYLAIARRLSGSDDLNNLISKLMSVISVVRMAQISLNMMMMSNPVTVAMGIAGMATTILSTVDIFAGY